MKNRLSLEDFATLCRETERVRDLWTHALAFTQARGIRMVSYHSNDAQLPGSRPLEIVADGFPEDWVHRYVGENLREVDPIPQLSARVSRPFLWSEVPKLTRLSRKQREYLNALFAAGLGDGFAMRAYGPNMRSAYVGLGFGGPAPEMSTAEIFELSCAVQICHLRYCELTAGRQSATEPLSTREHEILEWMARGKSNSVIADILGISRHTVDTLARRIYDKLQVNDRTTAAIRGLGKGLLLPP